MTIEQKKATVRRLLDVTVAGDHAALKALLTADFVAHQTGGSQNRESFAQHLDEYRMGFSDSHFAVREQVAEGDTVVTRATWHAVHTGNFQGVSPTGKQIAISAVLFVRFKENRIAEYRGLFDQLGMMQQLGLIPHSE